MTKEELFPQDEFPGRRRRILELPESNLRWVVELYFTNQAPTPEDDNPAGVVMSYSEINGPLSIVVADTGEKTYNMKDNLFVETPEEEIEELLNDISERIEEKNGPTNEDRVLNVLDERFDAEPWESF